MDGILPAPRQYDSSVQARLPKPGARIKVIGAGLPRTGTNSFCAAVSYLLGGPAYHVGFQTTATTNPIHFLNWIEVMRLWLAHQDRSKILAILDRELDGFVAIADPPSSQLIPELMELFPDAKVVCTTRDLAVWTKSMATVAKVTQPGQLQFFLFWIRSLRHFPTAIRLIKRVFEALYGVGIDSEDDCKLLWESHHEWLRKLVPEDKLYFLDTNEGWEPLCSALGVPIPEISFPRVNDKKTLEGAFHQWVMQGLVLWAVVIGFLAAAVGAGVWLTTSGCLFTPQA